MTETVVLDKPVPCAFLTGEVMFCGALAFGPPEDPRCADHGGPDLAYCGVCKSTITDDAEQYDCVNYYNGPIHVGCHPSGCRSVECREALSDPTGD